MAALRRSTIDYHNSLGSVVEMLMEMLWSMLMMVAVVGVLVTIFFRRVILYIFSYFWWFGVLGLRILVDGVYGLGFGACGVGLFGVFGLGLSI